MHIFSERQTYKLAKYAQYCIAFYIAFICLFATTESMAKDYSFAWSANPEPVQGYNLYYKKGGDPIAPLNGTDAVEGASPISVGKITSFTLSGLADNTTYHFTLTAYDGVEESGYSNIVTVFDTVPPETIDFELLEMQADHNWTKVTFSKPFVAPVVIAGPPGYADAAPATIRIRNVTSTGFEVRIQEWNYLDGNHAPEKFSFIVMEKGVYTLDNGTKIEAGRFTGSTSFQKIALQQTYALTPVVLTQVITYNETDAVTGRLRNGTKSSFEYSLQEQEKNTISHKPETVSYIAWEPGKGEYAGLLYESGFTTKSVTQNWFNLYFQTKFPKRPLFIAGIQTYEGSDTAALRNRNLSQTAVQVKVEEERSKDSETGHTAEKVGYLSIIALP